MTAAIRYEVIPSRPEAHHFTVRLTLADPGLSPVVLSMPAWTPGSYMIRDHARNIVSMHASRGGRPLAPVSLDKQSWRLEGGEGSLEVVYQLYARDISVRAARLDLEEGFFDGASLLLRVVGRETEPCELELASPAGHVRGRWRAYTALEPVAVDEAGFGTYRAADYWELIDSPVQMGSCRVLDFSVEEVEHRLVVHGQARFDGHRLQRDLERICAAQAALFGELPLERYLFLLSVAGDGYGGLEHRQSCALLCSRQDLPQPGESGVEEGYRRLLGLCSHEYFHLWNVKRIRPRALAESLLEREAHTRLLWVFEGITSYYDDLMLARSGVIGADSYLELLARAITRLQRTPGRRLQSLSDSSFHAWTKFYKQDENAPNAIVSYYNKGALAALGLDVELRLRSGDRVGLDDLMRTLWTRHGRTGIPVPEGGIRPLAEELAGDSLDDFFRTVVEGTAELPLEAWLSALGVGMRLRPARDEKDEGGVGEPGKEPMEARPVLGARWKQEGELVELLQVFEGGPAQEAGLCPGDRLVAVDGLQARPDRMAWLLAGAGGREVEVHAFRDDRLLRFRVRPRPAPADTCELWFLPEETLDPEVLARRRRWLGR